MGIFSCFFFHPGYTMHTTLPLVNNLPALQQVLSVCRIDWNVDSTSPELIQMSLGSSSFRMEERVYNVPETAAAMAKALIGARFPHLVEASQLSDFLPAAEAHIQDTVYQVLSAGSP